MTTGAAGPSVLFRCDATAAMGGGHLMRCLALADALAEQGAHITFVAAAMPGVLANRIADAGHELATIPPSEELNREGSAWEEPSLGVQAQLADAAATGAAGGQSDWVVVDHYLLDARWHSAARAFASNILVIDDLANRPCDCDILLDQNFGRSREDYLNLVPAGSNILAGATYAMLRPEFARERPAALERRGSGGPARRILVSMGTADPGGITARVLEQLIATAPGCAIDVVLGPQAASLEEVRALAAGHSRIAVHVNSRNMAELMRDADIAIGAAGTTSWERCCLGLPSIILILAENQRAGAEALSLAHVVRVADHADDVGAMVRALIGGAQDLARLSAASFAITDGRGTRRVLAAMLGEQAQGEITLRPATSADGELLWLWRNDPLTRAQSRASEPIGWQDHIRWLDAAIDRCQGLFFLAERNGAPIGTVRFDPLGDGGHEVSIAVAPEGRGSGSGAAMLRAACARLGSGSVYASVREDNMPSRRLFESCGFLGIDSAETGFLRYLLVMGGEVTSRRKKA